MTSPKTAGASDAAPRWATAALVLADGAVFWGAGVGAAGHVVGEVSRGADRVITPVADEGPGVRSARVQPAGAPRAPEVAAESGRLCA